MFFTFSVTNMCSRLHQNPCTSASQVLVARSHLDRICSLWSTFVENQHRDLPVLRNKAFWARHLKVLSKLRKLNLRAMLDHHCPTWPSEMLPSSQQQVQKFISKDVCQLSISLQVISFPRAFLHRIGLQDFLAVPQANVTSALNRLSLIMSPLKHMLMLCRLLSLTKGGHCTLAELLHVLPPPRAMLP